MHGLSIEIRLKDYLKCSVNPARIKKGLAPLTWKQYQNLPSPIEKKPRKMKLAFENIKNFVK